MSKIVHIEDYEWVAFRNMLCTNGQNYVEQILHLTLLQPLKNFRLELLTI